MNSSLLEVLSFCGLSEQLARNGTPLDPSYCYTSPKLDVIDRKKIPGSEHMITASKHPRFVEIPPHRHNFIEVMYVCQGQFVHTIGGQQIHMEPGDFLFMNEYTTHSVSYGDETDLAVDFILCPEFFDFAFEMVEKRTLLSDYLVGLLRKNANWDQYLLFKTKDHLPVSYLAEILMWHFFSGSTSPIAARDENIFQMIMALILVYITKDLQILNSSTSTGLADITMNTVYSYIETYYKNASLMELACSMHTSVSALSRQIKNLSGKTFVELLQSKRFDHATFLLRNTDLPISDISNAVGYENSSYFYRQFRDRYHVSPKNYRRRR